jgi:hypothetical protein
MSVKTDKLGYLILALIFSNKYYPKGEPIIYISKHELTDREGKQAEISKREIII